MEPEEWLDQKQGEIDKEVLQRFMEQRAGLRDALELEEWLDSKEHIEKLMPRTNITYRPYSLWLVAMVVFVATIFGVVVAELAIWWGGQMGVGVPVADVVGV